MSLILAPQFTQRNYLWTDWKVIQVNKTLLTQYDDNGIVYTIWGYDGPEVHLCTIWKGTVPDGMISSGYSQSQNDSDKSDFETNFKPTANAVIVPRSTDGKPNQLPNLFPIGSQVTHPGAGDDMTNPTSGIGGGTDFSSSTSDLTATTHTIEWQFLDPVYLAGGQINYSGAVFGDTINYLIVAKATSTTSGGGTGNADLAGPGNVLIVPNNGAGSKNVNLSACQPVPNAAGTGHWDWTAPANGVGLGTVTANYSGTGGYDLYTVDIKLGNLLGPGYKLMGTWALDFTIPAIIPKKLLPQWTHRVLVYNSGGTHTLQLVWTVKIARYRTV